MTMEFVSISDGEKAMANEGYVLFIKYLKFANFGAEHKELVFIKAKHAEVMRAISLCTCKMPFRFRYTKNCIIHFHFSF